jgi:hypothetical protein
VGSVILFRKHTSTETKEFDEYRISFTELHLLSRVNNLLRMYSEWVHHYAEEVIVPVESTVNACFSTCSTYFNTFQGLNTLHARTDARTKAFDSTAQGAIENTAVGLFVPMV